MVGRRLAELVREHRPTSVGLALVQDDLHEGVCDAAEAFAAMTAEAPRVIASSKMTAELRGD